MKMDLNQCKIVENIARYKTTTKQVNDQLRNYYENRVYELDTYRSILSRVIGHDYRFCKSILPSDFGDLTRVQIRQFDGLFSKKCKKCMTLKAP